MQYFYGLLWLLTAHFIADFVLQSDRVAQGKSKSVRILAEHIGIYTMCLLVAAIPLAFIIGHHGGRIMGLWIVINGGAHFVTDYITSRINSHLWATKQVHNFFVGVGADQLIHALTLGLTMVWLLRP